MPHSSPATPYRLDSIKICGTTNTADRDLVAKAGADYFGVLVEVGYSPRSISLSQAKPLFESPPIPGIVLLFNVGIGRVQPVVEQLNPFAVQLLGHEPPEFIASLKSVLNCQVWKSLHVPAKGRGEIDLEEMRMQAEEYEDSGADALLFNTLDSSGGTTKFGGTGMVADWGVLRGLIKDRMVPGFLAGGLNPDNIVTALQMVRPSGIDLCSGVESSPGKKDPKKLAKLFEVLSPLRAETPPTPD